jgi:hypothetical protein
MIGLVSIERFEVLANLLLEALRFAALRFAARDL